MGVLWPVKRRKSSSAGGLEMLRFNLGELTQKKLYSGILFRRRFVEGKKSGTVE